MAGLKTNARQLALLNPFLVRPVAGRTEPAIATHRNSAPSWSTSTFSNSAETSPTDLSVLGEHLGHCQGAQGRWFTLHCVAETLNRFLSSRLVTTLVVAALSMVIASLAL